jgi:hypothetical protein
MKKEREMREQLEKERDELNEILMNANTKSKLEILKKHCKDTPALKEIDINNKLISEYIDVAPSKMKILVMDVDNAINNEDDIFMTRIVNIIAKMYANKDINKISLWSGNKRNNGDRNTYSKIIVNNKNDWYLNKEMETYGIIFEKLLGYVFETMEKYKRMNRFSQNKITKKRIELINNLIGSEIDDNTKKKMVQKLAERFNLNYARIKEIEGE